jgi:hypothetical protein
MKLKVNKISNKINQINNKMNNNQKVNNYNILRKTIKILIVEIIKMEKMIMEN